MNLNNQTYNNYSFEIFTKKREYSQLLTNVHIFKRPSATDFVFDKYTFVNEASDLLSQIYDDMYVKISITVEGVTTLIYENKFIISKVTVEDGFIHVETDSEMKNIWVRHADFSKVCDNVTCKTALKDYINEVVAYTKKPVKFYMNDPQNVNKYVYEKIMFPQQEHYMNIKDVAIKYHLINNPFYIFFDDYNFGIENQKTNFFSVCFYNFYDLKTLRSHHMANLKLDRKQFLKSMGTYITPELRMSIFNTDSHPVLHDEYITKKLKNKNAKNTNSSSYISDSFDNFVKRFENTKTFYKDKVYYATTTLDDFDIRQLVIGDRLVIDEQKTDFQYYVAIVEASYEFSPSDATMAASKNVKSSMFSLNAAVSCLLKIKE